MKPGFVTLAATFFASSFGVAAPHSPEISEILMQPVSAQLESAKRLGLPRAFEQSKKIAKDRGQSLNLRWAAVFLMSKTGGAQAWTDLVALTKDADWYVRNAALLALADIESEKKLPVARAVLQSDKSLIVRSAAVTLFDQALSESDKMLFMSLVDSRNNFHRDQGLWIRGQLMEKLSPTATFADRDWYLQKVKDKDPKVSQLATEALERITGQKVPLSSATNSVEVFDFYNEVLRR